MSAAITKGYTFGATELVTNSKLHSLVDDATILGIVNAEIASGAAIDESKLSLTGENSAPLYVFYEGEMVSYEEEAVVYN